VEPDGERRKKFKENLTRLHPQLSISVFSETLQDFAKNCSMRFHGILLDAPCSGTGVTGRHPDIRWNRRIEDLLEYQKTQLELLQTAAKLLHPGGVLVYATCSLEKEENTDVVEQFLTSHETFTLDTCEPFVGKNGAALLRGGNFHPLPGEETDGFFAVRLQHKS
jgi:16S rRNA (cytosine967-C5)-methyltransferase